MELSLLQLVFLVLLVALPIASKKVEHNLELFFLAMAVAGATLEGLWSLELLKEAFLHPLTVYQPGIGYVPIGITQVVLAAGLVFYFFRHRLAAKADVLGKPGVLALLILALGLSSSVISAIVAAAVLAELLGFAKAPHGYKARAAVYGAYAIGAGAALLPIGEPLSTIAVAKLKQGFFYLVDVLLDAVFIIVAFFALYAYFVLRRLHAAGVEVEPYEPELREVLLRAAKIFIFIFALTILGEFFKPIAEVVAGLGKEVLYVFGMLSAVADNATLVAALVAPGMAEDALRSFLISLVLSGGFTVPGNVPNIVLATVLKIGFREWIKLAFPIGLAVFVAMGLYVLALMPHPPFSGAFR
jgi:predicted cation transporter